MADNPSFIKRLSIIVPIYNVRSYIEKCLRSLENQDIPKEDYEIICINDGSQDESSEVVKNLQKEFDNIILIDQDNQGVSGARNCGINKARGNYILFVDADDFVDANSFASILKVAEETEIQVSFLGYIVLKENGKVRYKVNYEQYFNQIKGGIETYFITHHEDYKDPDGLWGVLIKLEFLNYNNLQFLPNTHYLEDGEFMARVLCLADRCVLNGRSFYQHTTRSGSATHSKLFNSEKAVNGFFLAATNLKKFQQEQNLNREQRDFLNQPICKFVVLTVVSALKPFSLMKIVGIRKKLNGSGLGNLRLDSVDKVYKKFGYFYNKSLLLLIIYQYIIYRINAIRLRITSE